MEEYQLALDNEGFHKALITAEELIVLDGSANALRVVNGFLNSVRMRWHKNGEHEENLELFRMWSRLKALTTR